jgi:polyferredoxin/tetratricopeptide (TPR) repeat protein
VAVLIGIHLLIALHVAHWISTGETLSPLEPSESMEFSTRGVVNAGLVFFLLTIGSTLVFGRWFCGWACHLVALQDAARWLLLRLGITPRPLRSRALLWVPLVAFLYMFVAPLALRLLSDTATGTSVHLQTTEFWKTFPTWPVALVTLLVSGFASVWFLGSKGFCTYACPYGAIFGLADRLAPMRIRVTDACQSCGKCTASCSSNVLVHAEVRDYGMVVDPGCMKCLDCVAGCPNDALYLGFGRPALFKQRTAKASDKARKPAFGLGDELFLAAAFVLAFLAFRGIYGVVPFLLALALGGLVAYGTLLTVRLVSRPSVKLLRWHLKKSGTLQRLGKGFGCAALAVGALWIHSGVISFNDWRANVLHAQTGSVHPGPHPWRAQLARPAQLSAEQRTLVEKALGHATFVADAGLLRSTRNDLRLAWLHLLLGHDDEAEAHVVAVLAELPDAASVHSDYAAFLAARGRPNEARASFQNALAFRPDDDATRYALARLLVTERDLDGAASEYALLVEHFPRRTNLLLEAGSVEASRGELARAAKLFKAAVALEPGRPNVRTALINLLVASARLADAAAACEPLLAANPADPLAHRVIGLDHATSGRTKLAERHLRRALQTERHPDALRALATLLDAKGARDEAARLRSELR